MLDKRLYQAGYRVIIGVDEAGRGPWAGPLVAGAVAFDWSAPELIALLKGIKDSKQMTPNQRTKAVAIIHQQALTYGVGIVSAAELNEINQMTRATIIAMQRAVAATTHAPDYLLLDYHNLPNYSPEMQEAHKKGETVSLSIAAASVLAKTKRDALMMQYAQQYPQYGFDAHKGYGTKQHRQALIDHGVTPIHRCNYAPVAQAIAGTLV
jgi:ribonuclease HII